MKKLIIASAIVATLALSASVYAAIPSATNVITGCYGNLTGNLRLIDKESSNSCLGTETEVSWNQQGLVGPVGAQGPAGEQGPQGVQGIQGVQGQTGSSSTITVSSGPQAVPVGTSLTVFAGCTNGKLTGGGYRIRTNGYVHPALDYQIIRNFPNSDNYTVEIINVGTGQFDVEAYGICLN